MAAVENRGPIVYLNVNGSSYYYDVRRSPIGSGAMGTVYLGFATNTQEPVAIKRVIDKYANISSIRERAKQESSLMFRHQNLIEMLGCCEQYPGRGALYIISRFVQGQNIDQFIARNFSQNTPDRAKRICTLFYPVLDALSYIHSYNIIHMDIKPSNIMVENGRNVRLMDLGIAHVSHKLDLDGKASLMGTPRYAAPEQFEVSSDTKLDARTDIYEAGVTLYELLTGYNPYQAESIAESVRKHRNVVIPYVQGVPNALIDVLRKATSPVPSQRYLTAKEFKQAIRCSLIQNKYSSKSGLIVFLMTIILTVLAIFVFIVKSSI